MHEQEEQKGLLQRTRGQEGWQSNQTGQHHYSCIVDIHSTLPWCRCPHRVTFRISSELSIRSARKLQEQNTKGCWRLLLCLRKAGAAFQLYFLSKVPPESLPNFYSANALRRKNPTFQMGRTRELESQTDGSGWEDTELVKLPAMEYY